MARPTIRDNGVPLTPGERQQRWRRMKRLRKLADKADLIESLAYDAMKEEEEAQFQRDLVRMGFK